MAPLLEVGVLELGESCLFEVVVDPRDPSISRPQEKGIEVTVSLRSTPLTYLRVSLRPLLERATPVALLDEEVLPVFYTQEAFAIAEVCARRGAEAKVESGGALFGSLAVCPETGEFFAIIHDVIEVQDAEENSFSLRLPRQLVRPRKSRRAAAYPERADRPPGQTHGHPFRPTTARCVPNAETRDLTLTSAGVAGYCLVQSGLACQPWALCHIFGLTAREPAHQLFAKDGACKPAAITCCLISSSLPKRNNRKRNPCKKYCSPP
jgi:hypothetical protein